MRRSQLCALLLALILVLSAIPAFAQNANLSLLNDENTYAYASSMVWGKDTLYVLTNGNIYTWQSGQDAPTLWAQGAGSSEGMMSSGEGMVIFSGTDTAIEEDSDIQVSTGAEHDTTAIINGEGPSILRLMYDDGQLYGLDTMEGKVYKLSQAEGVLQTEEIAQLDWTQMQMDYSGFTMNRDIHAVFFQDGILYLLAIKEDFATYDLYACDLKTGGLNKLAFENVLAAAPYGTGKVLLATCVLDPMATSQAPITLMIGDLATGKTTLLATLSATELSGLQYQPATGLAAFFAHGQIFTVDQSGSTNASAYAPITYGAASAAWLDNYNFAISDGSSIYVRDVTPGKEVATALNISGNLYDEAYNTFIANNPDFPLVINSPTWKNGESLMTSMASGSTDIYLLSTKDIDFEAFKQKGYMDTLSSDLLNQQASAMYPWIQDALLKDGNLVAYPQSLNGTWIGYDPLALEALGLTEDDLPKTLGQLIDFIGDWEDVYQEAAPDLTLFDTEFYNLPVDYFGEMLFTLAQANGIAYDSTEFTALAQKVAQGNYDAVKHKEAALSGVITSVQFISSSAKREPTSLFTVYQDLCLPEWSTQYQYYQPLPLAFADGQEATFPLTLNLFIVNPYSTNKENAMTFLEAMAESMTQTTRTNLMPTEDTPIPDPYYEENLAMFQQALASAEHDYENATEADKKWKQEVVEDYKAMLANAENSKWNISPSDITTYRERAKQFRLTNYDPLPFHSEEVSALWQRLLSGQATPEQFGKTLAQKIEMILLESK